MSNKKGSKPSGLFEGDPFLKTLLKMPRKILDHHEVDGVAQMILHELGQQENLDFKKAFFLISSPDFNHLKGVAGFCRNESSHCRQKMWDDPTNFYQEIQKTSFHAEMKSLLQNDHYHHDGALHKDEHLQDIGKTLNMQSPNVYSWNLRNGNKGILIFEEGDKKVFSTDQDILDHVTALLGLCPL